MEQFCCTPPNGKYLLASASSGSLCLWHCLLCFLWRYGPTRAMASSFLRLLDHTQRRITVGRTPLDEWSARRRDLYLTTHNTHNRQTSIPPLRFEPTISVGERPQTYALDRAATGTGLSMALLLQKTGALWFSHNKFHPVADFQKRINLIPEEQ